MNPESYWKEAEIEHLVYSAPSRMLLQNSIFINKGASKMSSAKQADVSKLDNPAWSKANHQTRTEPGV